jgi:ubiquinone/menaquinone biosynthesis C-methylase UbiE
MLSQGIEIPKTTSTLWGCPRCRYPLDEANVQGNQLCHSCGQNFSQAKGWIDFCISQDEVNIATEAAYKIYSRFYAPVALLVYLIIWRGNFIRHVRFFGEILRKQLPVIDLATGDGSLTALALFKLQKKSVEKLIAVDISGGMLEKARKKLSYPGVQLVRGDVCQLPFLDHSIQLMSCFGGFNSFPSGEVAMCEMARCLAKQGILRGSLLLMPKDGWRKKLVLDWIKKGYQTEEIQEAKFKKWVNQAGLRFSHFERHGDVLLFELVHSLKNRVS